MRRRTVLTQLGAVGTTVMVSGCTSMFGDGEPDAGATDTSLEPDPTETASEVCGPGEDSIGDLAELVTRTEEDESTPTGSGDEHRIQGEIRSIAEDEIVIDDGTGTATLTTPLGDGLESPNVDVGDCAEASGEAVPPEDGSDTDITFYVTEVALAD